MFRKFYINRSCFGHNNNPTTTCFIAAFKRIVSGALNRAEAGNCIFDVSPDHAANSDIPGIIEP